MQNHAIQTSEQVMSTYDLWFSDVTSEPTTTNLPAEDAQAETDLRKLEVLQNLHQQPDDPLSPSSVASQTLIAVCHNGKRAEDDQQKPVRSKRQIGARAQAERWLRDLLQDPCLAEDVQRLGLEAGIRPATLRRAKLFVGVVSVKSGGFFGGDDLRWKWRLPEKD